PCRRRNDPAEKEKEKNAGLPPATTRLPMGAPNRCPERRSRTCPHEAETIRGYFAFNKKSRRVSLKTFLPIHSIFGASGSPHVNCVGWSQERRRRRGKVRKDWRLTCLFRRESISDWKAFE